MTDRELLTQALEALEFFADEWGFTHKSTLPVRQNAIAALRTAIEQAEKQEPVAWELRKGKTDRVLLEITNDPKRAHDWKCSLEEVVPLYTAPQPAVREWQGLTDEKISDLWCEVSNTDFVTADTHVFARAIEAKLKERNT